MSCAGTEGDEIELESDVSETQEKTSTLDTVVENTVNTSEPGIYQEYHQNGQLKIEGLNNIYRNREGLWVSYYDDGTKWSENFYSNGIKSGHSVTFFPSGNVRYVGEYRNDERFGTWKFYDEQGNLTNEEKFTQ